MFVDKIIMCGDNIKEELMKYINNYFKLITPFEVRKGYRFQIRIKKERYETLPEKIKNDLRLHEYRDNDGRDVYVEGSEELKLWQEENYWSNTNSYHFHFKSIYSYKLNCRCEYGHDGLNETFSILFFDKNEFSPLIYKNIGANEREDNFKVLND